MKISKEISPVWKMVSYFGMHADKPARESASKAINEITTKSLMGPSIFCLIGGHALIAGALYQSPTAFDYLFDCC